MHELLDLCRNFPRKVYGAGEVFLHEGGRSNHLYLLAEGAAEVFRGDVSIAIVTDPGSVFGEMSLLLGMAHTASVRAMVPSTLVVIDNGLAHLKENPALLLPIAQLLAQRLRNSTTYLVDLKHQFQHHSDHFAMVDEVLESMTHQQGRDFTPAGGWPEGP